MQGDVYEGYGEGRCALGLEEQLSAADNTLSHEKRLSGRIIEQFQE